MNIMGKRFNVHCAACEGRGSTLMPVNARDKTDEFSKVPYRYIRIAKGWYHYHGLSSGANELAAETTKHMLCPICDGKSYFVKPDGWYADCDYCNDDDGICSFKILKREEPPKPENNEGSSADTPPADAAANPSATDAPPADAPPADAPPAV